MTRRLVLLVVGALFAAALVAPARAQVEPITLEAARGIVTAGEEIVLSGLLSAGRPECVANKTILVERTAHGSGLVNGITLGVSDEAGHFSGTLPAQVSADYAAIRRPSGPEDDCPSELSDPVTVLVRVRVTARAASDRVPEGMRGAIAGNVHPGHPGTSVVLQRRVGTSWRAVRSATLDDTSQFRFGFKVNWSRYRTFRVIWADQDDDHEAGRSARIRILSVPVAGG